MAGPPQLPSSTGQEQGRLVDPNEARGQAGGASAGAIHIALCSVEVKSSCFKLPPHCEPTQW